MATASNKLSLGQIILTILYLLIFPVVLLLLSGDWFWLEGWIFSIWFIVLCGVSIVYLYRKDPGLLAERFRQPGTGNQQGWDRYVVYLLLLGFITWIIIMPLDAKRLAWTTNFPPWLKVLGGGSLLIAFFFFYRAYTDNTFLSPLVRIQAERKQHVVSTGVYGIVRHPMYLGALCLFIGTPLLLGSVYGLIVGALMSLLLVARIIGEERLLATELEGYTDYQQQVKYRLIPLIW